MGSSPFSDSILREIFRVLLLTVKSTSVAISCNVFVQWNAHIITWDYEVHFCTITYNCTIMISNRMRVTQHANNRLCHTDQLKKNRDNAGDTRYNRCRFTSRTSRSLFNLARFNFISPHFALEYYFSCEDLSFFLPCVNGGNPRDPFNEETRPIRHAGSMTSLAHADCERSHETIFGWPMTSVSPKNWMSLGHRREIQSKPRADEFPKENSCGTHGEPWFTRLAGWERNRRTSCINEDLT